MYIRPKKCDIILLHPSKRDSYGVIDNELASKTPDIMMGLVDAYLEANSIVSVVIDLEVLNISEEAIIDLITNLNPRCVGVFAEGVNVSASTQTMPAVISFFNSVANKFPRYIKTFVYGGHPTVLPERTLDETNADYVILGEGYDAVLNLVKNIIENKSIGDIKGLAFKTSDSLGNISIKKNPMPPLINVNALPQVNWHKIPPSLYKAHNWHCFGDDIDSRSPYGVIWTGMGCAYPCDFCCVNNIFGKRIFRFRDMASVIKEVDILVNEYGVRHLRILDELFVIKHPRIYEFCDLLDKRGYDLNIWCYARVDSVNPSMLKRLKAVGVNWIGYGFESGDNEDALNSINKHVKKGSYSNDEVVKMTRDAGINMIGHAILGLYDDDEKAIKENMAFLYKHQFEWNNIYPAFAYPGTPFYDKYVYKEGIIKPPVSWNEYTLYGYECNPLPTKHLTSAQVLKLRDNSFIEYYQDEKVQANFLAKFGQKTVDHINNMLSVRIPRKILGD